MTKPIPTHLLALFALIESVFDSESKPVYLKQANGDPKHAKQLDAQMLTKRLQGMNLEEDEAFRLYTAYKENNLPSSAWDLKPARLAWCPRNLT